MQAQGDHIETKNLISECSPDEDDGNFLSVKIHLVLWNIIPAIFFTNKLGLSCAKLSTAHI